MFIKLTKLDNSPIWLNASFVVTVEPRKGGGSIVVPIGDGLDYEVREKAEVVLGLLEKAPVPAVVPVPVSDCLTQTPADVSPEPLRPEPEAAARLEKVLEEKSAERSAANVDSVQPPPPSAEPVESNDDAKPVRKTRKTTAKAKAAAKPRKRATKKGESDDAPPADDTADSAPPAEPQSEPGVPETPQTPQSAEEAPTAVPQETREVMVPPPEQPPLDDMQIFRLKKLMPRSVRKLANTLMAQFRIFDPFAVIRDLETRGVFRLDKDHVIWG